MITRSATGPLANADSALPPGWRDKKDRKVVGRDQGYCIRISPQDGSYECNWTAFLAGGQITVEGPFLDNAGSTLAITGGTGRYRRARGEMELRSRENGTKFDFIYRIAR
jgi:allene oxide cyclase